jgi:hypothetical protein
MPLTEGVMGLKVGAEPLLRLPAGERGGHAFGSVAWLQVMSSAEKEKQRTANAAAIEEAARRQQASAPGNRP